MPRLVIKHGKGVGRDHALGGGACVVGRDQQSAQFVLEDHLVSRQHFQVLQEAGAWFVEDLGSTNGTLVNGRKTQRVRLRDGDLIQVGGTRIAFVQKDLLGASGLPAPVPRRLKGKAQPPRTADEQPAAPPVRRRRHLK